MIPAYLYHYIYLSIVTIVSILCVIHYYKTVDDLRTRKSTIPALVLLVLMILFIGWRPIDKTFVDMADYALIMHMRQGDEFIFNWNTENIIYDNLQAFWCSERLPLGWFFFLFSVIYFSGIFIATRKLFQLNTLLNFLVYLGAFSTFSFGTNGIKAGAAASLFLVAVAYRKELFISIPFLLLSLGFHHSMTLPITAFVVAYLFHDKRYYLAFWVVSFILAAFHVTYFQEFLAGYADERGAHYLEIIDPSRRENTGATGFRLDFIIYSAIPIFLGYYLSTKHKLESATFDFLWCLYVLSNSVWLLCTYASYTNRIAYLSWCIYPFVLIYPFVNFAWSDRQEVYLRRCVFLHLGFTIFMTTIYSLLRLYL